MPQRTSYSSKNLQGTVGEVYTFPDKSISHRSIIIPSISEGVSEISNLLEGDDVLNTIDALRLAGVQITKEGSKWIVHGKGLNSLVEPTSHLYLGNSGTSTRLLAGLFAPYNFRTFFTGDASLSKRPMKRIFKPLEQMGASFVATSKNTLPFCMNGTHNLMPINYEMEVASAQVKSAILLAACQIKGTTTIIENTSTRNHTENMLQGAGAEISVSGNKITLHGGTQLQCQNISIPNDPSSAAFIAAAAILCEGSNITIKNVCINKTRAGFFETLIQMNACLEFKNKRTIGGEKVADISASHSPNLTAANLTEEVAPSMIDEYPILFVVTSFANGTSKFHGLKELTTKESNRLKIMEENLQAIGVNCKANYTDFSIAITGNPSFKPNSSKPLKTYMDHRIAMSCFIAGLKGNVIIDDDTYIKTSFPSFMEIMKNIGCNFS